MNLSDIVTFYFVFLLPGYLFYRFLVKRKENRFEKELWNYREEREKEGHMLFKAACSSLFLHLIRDNSKGRCHFYERLMYELHEYFH